MATIKEVAQRAGVSVTTVSRVLNKRGYISQEMHDKIYATMEELNYQPNEVARSLTRRRTKIIGLLVPSVDDPYFGEVVNQLILAAMRHGYKVMIYASDGQNDRALEYVGMLKANQVDGIIMVPTNNSQHVAKQIMAMNIPFVQVDRFIPGVDASYVILDNFKASYDLTVRLLSSGRKRIAMLKHKTSALNGRLEGYIKALEDNGKLHPELVKNINYRRRGDFPVT